MKTLFIAACLSLLCFGSCKKDADAPDTTNPAFRPDYFMFGYGGGIAGDHKTFVIKGRQLFAEDTASGALSVQKYTTAKVLIDHFPDYLLEHRNQRFGCTNCADTYGIGIVARIDGVEYFWNMDNTGDQLPSAIEEYANEVFRVTAQL